MKKTKGVVTRNAGELAKALGLTAADGAEIELRSDLNTKIAAVVARKGLNTRGGGATGEHITDAGWHGNS